MFDGLSNKLQDVFKKLKGQAILSESNITEAMREIRLALLDADVNYEIAKRFVDSIKKRVHGTGSSQERNTRATSRQSC